MRPIESIYIPGKFLKIEYLKCFYRKGGVWLCDLWGGEYIRENF